MRIFRPDDCRIVVQAGQKFAVEVPLVPTAGFEVEVATVPKTVRAVDRVSAGASAAIGGGATEQIVFEAMQPGSDGALEVLVRRPWETSGAQTHRWTVHVDP